MDEPMAWAMYAKELLIELMMCCPDEIHREQYEEVTEYIETGHWPIKL